MKISRREKCSRPDKMEQLIKMRNGGVILGGRRSCPPEKRPLSGSRKSWERKCTRERASARDVLGFYAIIKRKQLPYCIFCFAVNSWASSTKICIVCASRIRIINTDLRHLDTRGIVPSLKRERVLHQKMFIRLDTRRQHFPFKQHTKTSPNKSELRCCCHTERIDWKRRYIASHSAAVQESEINFSVHLRNRRFFSPSFNCDCFGFWQFPLTSVRFVYIRPQ